jgi:hypothetical protein
MKIKVPFFKGLGPGRRSRDMEKRTAGGIVHLSFFLLWRRWMGISGCILHEHVIDGISSASVP